MIAPAPHIGRLERRLIQLLDLFSVANLKIKLMGQDTILTYHSVESAPSGYRYSVAKELFAEQIDYLQARFEIVSLKSLLKEKSDQTRIALTFDDAYADFYENAYPLLRERNLPATVFVPTHFIETDSSLLARDENIEKPHLTWQQMHEIMANSAITFQSHTHTHRSAVNQQNAGALEADLQQSIDSLTKNLGVKPDFLAYPYGLFNSQTHQIALDCGFQTLLTMQDQPVGRGPVQGRLDIYQRNQTLPYFKLTVAGLLGPGMRQKLRKIVYRR